MSEEEHGAVKFAVAALHESSILWWQQFLWKEHGSKNCIRIWMLYCFTFVQTVDPPEMFVFRNVYYYSKEKFGGGFDESLQEGEDVARSVTVGAAPCL